MQSDQSGINYKIQWDATSEKYKADLADQGLSIITPEGGAHDNSVNLNSVYVVDSAEAAWKVLQSIDGLNYLYDATSNTTIALNKSITSVTVGDSNGYISQIFDPDLSEFGQSAPDYSLHVGNTEIGGSFPKVAMAQVVEDAVAKTEKADEAIAAAARAMAAAVEGPGDKTLAEAATDANKKVSELVAAVAVATGVAATLTAILNQSLPVSSSGALSAAYQAATDAAIAAEAATNELVTASLSLDEEIIALEVAEADFNAADKSFIDLELELDSTEEVRIAAEEDLNLAKAKRGASSRYVTYLFRFLSLYREDLQTISVNVDRVSALAAEATSEVKAANEGLIEAETIEKDLLVGYAALERDLTLGETTALEEASARVEFLRRKALPIFEREEDLLGELNDLQKNEAKLAAKVAKYETKHNEALTTLERDKTSVAYRSADYNQAIAENGKLQDAYQKAREKKIVAEEAFNDAEAAVARGRAKLESANDEVVTTAAEMHSTAGVVGRQGRI